LIRCRYDDPGLGACLPADQLVRRLVDADGGSLIWPRISSAEQSAADASCRRMWFARPCGNSPEGAS
jgi:hypothetical protein